MSAVEADLHDRDLYDRGVDCASPVSANCTLAMSEARSGTSAQSTLRPERTVLGPKLSNGGDSQVVHCCIVAFGQRQSRRAAKTEMFIPVNFHGLRV